MNKIKLVVAGAFNYPFHSTWVGPVGGGGGVRGRLGFGQRQVCFIQFYDEQL